MATLYVNADSASRSDVWTRAEAAGDPTKPFATMQACAMLLQAGDTMQVEPSTLGNANPADPFDADVYAGITHREENDASDILPAGDNGAGATIHVTGHIVGDILPKCRLLDFSLLDNWSFTNLQKGYDLGSGHDEFTISDLHFCRDLTFTNIVATGGAWNVRGGEGTLQWIGGRIYSPYQADNNHFLNGVGFRVLGYDDSSGAIEPVLFRFEGNHFENVRGEDCIQTAFNQTQADIEVIGNTFKNIGPADGTGIHTDCIQALGGNRFTIVDNTFINCGSCFIASDNHHELIEVIGNLIDEDCSNGILGQGCAQWIILHNTVKAWQLPVAIGNRYNSSVPGFEQNVIAVNNVYGFMDIASGAILADASVVEVNVAYLEVEKVTPWGTNLPGVAEFGTSERLFDAGIDDSFELANTPTDSAGIGDGRALTGLGLTSDELAYAAADRFGRTFASPRDVGALQSDPGTPVSASARPPYIISRAPAANAASVAAGVDVTVTLYPKPGQTVDPDSVSSSTVYVTDAAGLTLPAVVTLSDADGAGQQTITLDLVVTAEPFEDGDLFPLVTYTVHLTADVADTEGSALSATSWSFRVVGTGGPAIGAAGTGPSAQTFTLGSDPRFHVGATVYLWRGGGGLLPFSPIPVTSAVVAADSTTTFTGLTRGTDYLAGFVVSGPFISFRT